MVVAAAVALFSIGAQAASKLPSKDIVDTAVEAGSFKTLAAALQAADLVSTLKGEGPFTVFAPTDAAFAKIPKADLDALLKDKEALTKVLTYHVLPARVLKAEIPFDTPVATVQGSAIQINRSFQITDQRARVSQITAPDVFASNGVVHVIDKVLLPN